MASETDERIFVCGVTQQSMGSGKFPAEDIPGIARLARDAFRELWGTPVADAPGARRPSPGAASAFQRAPTPQAPSGVVGPETKPFSMWGGDKAHIFEDPEKAWCDWLADAQQGDATSAEALQKASKASLGKDPKWHNANARRISRAKACLAMLKGPTADDYNGPPPEETPF